MIVWPWETDNTVIIHLLNANVLSHHQFETKHMVFAIHCVHKSIHCGHFGQGIF